MCRTQARLLAESVQLFKEQANSRTLKNHAHLLKPPGEKQQKNMSSIDSLQNQQGTIQHSFLQMGDQRAANLKALDQRSRRKWDICHGEPLDLDYLQWSARCLEPSTKPMIIFSGEASYEGSCPCSQALSFQSEILAASSPGQTPACGIDFWWLGRFCQNWFGVGQTCLSASFAQQACPDQSLSSVWAWRVVSLWALIPHPVDSSPTKSTADAATLTGATSAKYCTHLGSGCINPIGEVMWVSGMGAMRFLAWSTIPAVPKARRSGRSPPIPLKTLALQLELQQRTTCLPVACYPSSMFARSRKSQQMRCLWKPRTGRELPQKLPRRVAFSLEKPARWGAAWTSQDQGWRTYVAMLQNRHYFGIGEFTTHFRTYFSGWIGMFTGGYDLDFDPWPCDL